MKRLLFILGFVSLLNSVNAQEIIMKTGCSYAYLDGEIVYYADNENYIAPYYNNNKVFIPLRPLVDWLDGEISWEPKTKAIGIEYKDYKLYFKPFTDYYTYLDTKEKFLEKPIILNGNTYIYIEDAKDLLDFEYEKNSELMIVNKNKENNINEYNELFLDKDDIKEKYSIVNINVYNNDKKIESKKAQYIGDNCIITSIENINNYDNIVVETDFGDKYTIKNIVDYNVETNILVLKLKEDTYLKKLDYAHLKYYYKDSDYIIDYLNDLDTSVKKNILSDIENKEDIIRKIKSINAYNIKNIDILFSIDNVYKVKIYREVIEGNKRYIVASYEFYSIDDKIYKIKEDIYDKKYIENVYNYQIKELNESIYYIGEMREDTKYGYGIYYDQKGNVQYIGYWKDDLPNGKCKAYEDGIIRFEGNMKYGKATGYGKEYDENGNIIYEGLYIDGKKDTK